ncbi:GNAT family N-acetyltransferase [Micromonospora sp. NPDC049559]|uniref:GNAT family N-acetyltransferase n=1 Tax=Micromonospora sp. NPDC049559 TaxID=3155923 RepID=UPI0034364BE7
MTAAGALDSAVLDRVVWASLTGAPTGLVEVAGEAARYHPDVSPFASVADPADPRGWHDLAALAGPGGEVLLTGEDFPPPESWEITWRVDGVQMVGLAVAAADDPEVVPLGPDDVPEMLDLTERTRPGPFRPRTVEMGTYLGIRRDGRLAAMAGERLRPPGWTEISAVCTDPAYRGQGLAGRLIRAVAAGIRRRDEIPFLHTGADNTNAIRLYEALGFELRREVTFAVARVPQPPTP